MLKTVLNRQYLLFVPAGDGPFPLIVGLHGGLGNPTRFNTNTQLGTKGVSRGYAVALPNGTGGTWNVGGCCGAAYEQNIDDVGFVQAVIADVAAQYAIQNPTRAFLIGHSLGGDLAYRVLSDRPESVRAVGVQSASVGALSFGVARRVLHIHGTADTNVPYNGGIGPITGQLHPPVRDTLAQLIAPLGVSATVNITGAVQDNYFGEPCWVRLRTIVGGGHDWMDESTDTLLDFFDGGA